MINANELRIGNLVHVVYAGHKEVSVHTIVAEDIVDIVNKKITSIPSAIPLTPEIMEKAGFELNTGDECYYIYHDENNVHIEFDCDSKEVWIGGFNSSSTMEHIKQLHQLQNLYYSLTGKELTINL